MGGGFAEDEAQGYGVGRREGEVFVGFAEERTWGEVPPCRYLLLNEETEAYTTPM